MPRLAVLAVQLGDDGEDVGERVRAGHGLPVAGEPGLARRIEGGEKQVVETAEVVEDERLVELAAACDRP